MTTNKTTRETLSRKALQEKIDFLPKKIASLPDDLKANTLFSTISSADVIREFERIKLKHSESSRTRLRILNILVAHKGSLTWMEVSGVFRFKYSAKVIDKLIKEGPVTGEAIDGGCRAENVTITRKGIAFIEKTMPNRLKTTNEVTHV